MKNILTLFLKINLIFCMNIILEKNILEAWAEEDFSVVEFDHFHKRWDSVLSNFVHIDGPKSMVAYGKLKNNSSEFENYLNELESVEINQFKLFPREEQLAFLINAYNAFTIKLILENYPVKSIRETGGWFSTPWKKKFIVLFGKQIHLDNIEHGMIRQAPKDFEELDESIQLALKKFNDPRIHFAVNCASKSCPPLRGEAYLAFKLSTQLEDGLNIFIKDPSNNYFSTGTKEVHLSKIFKWYRGDFEEASGSLLLYVAPKMANNPQEEEKIKNGKIKFLEYDWSLNGE